MGSRSGIVAVVQTAAGIENVDNIAGTPGTLRLAFGTGLEWELGITGGAAALLYARSRLVMASYAAELPGPIDGTSPDLDDIVALGEDLRHAVGLGFTGKTCLHPLQLRMTNSAFAPASSKLAWARRVLAATRASPTSVARVDGEMVDWQHIDAARQIVARAALFDPGGGRIQGTGRASTARCTPCETDVAVGLLRYTSRGLSSGDRQQLGDTGAAHERLYEMRPSSVRPGNVRQPREPSWI